MALMAPERTRCWPATIAVAGLPPSPNRRMNWQARRRIVRPLADAVAWQARAVGLAQPLERAHVVVTMVHRRGPVRDWDNCVSSLKEIVDALKGILIVDDSPAHLRLEVAQLVGLRRGLLLEVWPDARQENAS